MATAYTSTALLDTAFCIIMYIFTSWVYFSANPKVHFHPKSDPSQKVLTVPLATFLSLNPVEMGTSFRLHRFVTIMHKIAPLAPISFLEIFIVGVAISYF